ncbi:hypothetical protein JOE23_002954 [Amphibacillus cookii]|nr:hypothetical protein [Amphibacillus cookii]
MTKIINEDRTDMFGLHLSQITVRKTPPQNRE